MAAASSRAVLVASLVSSGGVQMRLPRFRVRTLMLGVGVLALLVWGAMMGTRSYHYYRLASFYSFEERAPSPLGGEARRSFMANLTHHLIAARRRDGGAWGGLRWRERPSRAPRRVSAARQPSRSPS